jgi:type I restriction enzyme S subunit
VSIVTTIEAAPMINIMPSGWSIVKLGEICSVNPKYASKIVKDNPAVSFISMSAVSEKTGTAIPEKRAYEEVRRGYTYFQEEDVLFAKITPCMENGKHFIARGLINGFGFGSTEFHVIRPNKAVISEWIYFYLRQPSVLAQAATYFTGTVGQQRVPSDFLKSLLIPLPPLIEQKRITSILEKQMAEMERARTAINEQLDAAKALSFSYLRDIFENVEAKKWPKKLIMDIAETCSGATPSRGQSNYYSGNIPWVKTGELLDGFITDTDEHINELAIRDTSLKILPPGTLLVAMYGQGQTRGRTGILLCNATINQACFAILPNPELYKLLFIQYWFRYSYYRLRKETEGRGGNQPNLNGQVLRKQYVPLPAIEKQKRICENLTQKLKSVECIKNILNDELNTINCIPQTILHYALMGQL